MGRIGDRGEMEAFVRCIELGNFSAAGRELGLSPSGVSKLVTRLERYPEVQLELLLEDRTMEIVRENVDLSVTVWPPQNTAVVTRELFSFGRIACAAPAYIQRHGMPQLPEDLARHRCLRVVSTLQLPWRFVTPDGVRSAEVKPAIVVNNSEQCLRFVLAGLGITQMMEFQVADFLRRGELVPVMPGFPCPDVHTMRVVYLQERHRLPRVRAMIDFLFETFASRKPGAGRTAPTRAEILSGAVRASR